MIDNTWVDKKIKSPLSSASRIVNFLFYALILFCLVSFLLLIPHTNVAFLFLVILFFLILSLLADYIFYKKQTPLELTEHELIFCTLIKKEKINILDINNVEYGNFKHTLSIMMLINLLFSYNGMFEFFNISCREMSKKTVILIQTKNNNYSVFVNDAKGLEKALSMRGISIKTQDTAQ